MRTLLPKTSWSQLTNLAVAVLFILAFKALSLPKSARLGTLIVPVVALIATVLLLFSRMELHNIILIVRRIRIVLAIGLVLSRPLQLT